jgi:hypothetical protein
MREVSHMLKAVHAQESREAADRKARAIVDDLRAARMNTAADLVEGSVCETLTWYAFPDIHWQKIRTTDEIDKSFLLDLLFLRSTGDRVAKSRARGCHLRPRSDYRRSSLAVPVRRFSGRRGCHRLTNCS